MLLAANPRSCMGGEKDEDAAVLTEKAIGAAGRLVNADAADSDSGLPDACADVVIGEAILTMQSDAGGQRIVAEAAQVLRPGGRHAIPYRSGAEGCAWNGAALYRRHR